MSEWLRWKIIMVLDKFPGLCWADLVTWANYKEPWRELFDMGRGGKECCRDIPYCGKCGRQR